MTERGRPLFISWSVRHGRSRGLADALGADALFFGVRRRRNPWTAPFRQATAMAQTVGALVRRRPRWFIVMAPPLSLAIVAVAYAGVTRTPLGIDAHTAAVLSKRSGRRRWSLVVLGRRAEAVIVTNTELAVPLRDRGVRCVTLHDAASDHSALDLTAATDEATFTIVAPLSWEADEPVGDIIEMSRRCEWARVIATGRPPAAYSARTDLPPNLELAGYLDDDAFHRLMASAGVVLALTTRNATMQQAGYEAMEYGRPVIASDTGVLREYFGDAALYADSASSLTDAVERVRADPSARRDAVLERRGWAAEEFERGRRELLSCLNRRV